MSVPQLQQKQMKKPEESEHMLNKTEDVTCLKREESYEGRMNEEKL